MEAWDTGFRGRFERRVLQSEVLRSNPLGDPAARPLWVYVPPGVDPHQSPRYPAIYVIQGMLNQVDMWWNRNAFRPTVPELVDAFFAEDGVPPALMVFVDAWTALGGSQFLNSPATGRYLDYLCDDVVTFVDGHYPTIASAGHRAIAGHSSGGYGAMVVPMLRPGVFGALASHAGDALFEFAYMPDIAAAARALQVEYGGSYDAFWADFRSRPAFTKRSDAELLSVYAMSAAYSPGDGGSVVLPFDPRTCIIRDDVWRRWLEHDPVRMAARHSEALLSLRGIYLDAGDRDDYYLDLGARAFSAQMHALGVDHRIEFFDGGHGRMEYRYPRGWRFLLERMVP